LDLLNDWSRKAGRYLTKMKGEERNGSPNPLTRANLVESLWAWLGAALGIGACAFLSSRFFEPRAATLIIGSFGASAVLVYGTFSSPLSQPRNLVGGHLISGLVGVACYQLVGIGWLAAALAVSLALVAMLLTKTVHPPGGATALIAVIGGEQIHRLGFLYPLMPVLLGALILLLVALVVNNLPRDRQFPRYWW
jgi:CBS-domain-containing membrane protein